jgi:hypothetical protein
MSERGQSARHDVIEAAPGLTSLSRRVGHELVDRLGDRDTVQARYVSLATSVGCSIPGARQAIDVLCGARLFDRFVGRGRGVGSWYNWASRR